MKLSNSYVCPSNVYINFSLFLVVYVHQRPAKPITLGTRPPLIGTPTGRTLGHPRPVGPITSGIPQQPIATAMDARRGRRPREGLTTSATRRPSKGATAAQPAYGPGQLSRITKGVIQMPDQSMASSAFHRAGKLNANARNRPLTALEGRLKLFLIVDVLYCTTTQITLVPSGHIITNP